MSSTRAWIVVTVITVFGTIGVAIIQKCSPERQPPPIQMNPQIIINPPGTVAPPTQSPERSVSPRSPVVPTQPSAPDTSDKITVNSSALCDFAKEKYKIECMYDLRSTKLPSKSIIGQMVWDDSREKWRRQIKFFNGSHKTDVTIKMIEYVGNLTEPKEPLPDWIPFGFAIMFSNDKVEPEFR